MHPAQVLAVAMREPRSYTAEDVVEVHTHGGAVPARRVLAALLQRGARLARPGEFTLRAFLNGRLDLSQVGAHPRTLPHPKPSHMQSNQGVRGNSFSYPLYPLVQQLLNPFPFLALSEHDP